jgi:hypothetical protein
MTLAAMVTKLDRACGRCSVRGEDLVKNQRTQEQRASAVMLVIQSFGPSSFSLDKPYGAGREMLFVYQVAISQD